MNSMKNHWKLVVGALSAALIIAIFTYLAGPIVIFYAIKAAYFVLYTTAKLAGSLLSNCAKASNNKTSESNLRLL